MSTLVRFLSGAAVVALIFGASTHSAQSAAAKPQLLSTLVGTWNCSYTGPKGTLTSSITFTSLNDMWLQDTEKDGKYGDRPAHAGFGYFGYDAKKHQYVSMGGSSLPGDYGIGTADAAPDAMVMTFVGAYPADPTHDKTVYHFTSNKVTSIDTWTKNGKSMTGNGSCTKQ